MLIRQKLTLTTVVMAVGLVILLSVALWGFAAMRSGAEQLAATGRVSSLLTSSLVGVESFTASKSEAERDATRNAIEGLTAELKVLAALLAGADELEHLNDLKQETDHFAAVFNDYAKRAEEVGLTPETGLYGSLRNAVHSIEKTIYGQQDYRTAAAMLQLRRHEKDFMLRLDSKYVGKFDEAMETLRAAISDSNAYDAATKAELARLADQYAHDFKALVAGTEQLGFTDKTGLRGQLSLSAETLRQGFSELSEAVLLDVDGVSAATTRTAMALGGAVLLVMIFATVSLSRSVTVAVTDIARYVRRVVADNDLTLQLDGGNRNDEMVAVGRQIGQFTASFRATIERVQTAVASLNGVTDELSRGAEQAHQDLVRQQSETDMVATAITEMGATIDEIAKNTEQAARNAAETNHNAQRGRQEVDATSQRIRELAARLNDASGVVTTLAQQSHTVGSVLEVIRGIAEQTNLLALNAAIEAARAGEQGRGFAVVADEVRSLALRTQQSTNEIGGIITSLQQQTQQIVALIQTCRDEGLASAQQAEQAGQLLGLITNDVGKIMDMSSQIAAAIEEQSHVAAEVNRNVVNIRDITGSSLAAANANAASAEAVARQSSTLADGVKHYRV